MPKDECKHENAGDKKFCPDCGAQTQSEEQQGRAELKSAIREALEEAGIIKSKPTAPAKKKSVLDRVTGK